MFWHYHTYVCMWLCMCSFLSLKLTSRYVSMCIVYMELVDDRKRHTCLWMLYWLLWALRDYVSSSNAANIAHSTYVQMWFIVVLLTESTDTRTPHLMGDICIVRRACVCGTPVLHCVCTWRGISLYKQTNTGVYLLQWVACVECWSFLNYGPCPMSLLEGHILILPSFLSGVGPCNSQRIQCNTICMYFTAHY